METINKLGPELGIAATCAALGLARATFYRQGAPKKAATPRKPSLRALGAHERQAVLNALHAPRFADKAPAEVYATLLDEGTYVCSERTMYRVLAQSQEVRERRDQLRHPSYKKPELLATAPNQLWSWDITKLLGPAKWTYFQLYVLLDVFSRYVVGWLVAERESSTLAKKLIAESCERQNVHRDQLTVHADRGTSMTSKNLALLLADLGITKSHSRPHVSNDNPFSEAQFKTLKYRPGFPDRFGSVQDVRSFGQVFFPWYNDEHRHSGLGLLTPADVHYGRATTRLAARATTLDAAYLAHPERFVNGRPVPAEPPSAVWINPPPSPLGAYSPQSPSGSTPVRAKSARAVAELGSITTKGVSSAESKF